MMKRLKIEYGPVTASNVSDLRKLNAACFPIAYGDAFYEDVVKRGDPHLNKFAFWRGTIVGALCARVEPVEDENRRRIYIMTLGVVAALRGRQVGTQLIESLLEYCETEKEGKLEDVDEIALHVQISNKGAIQFYTKRFGFIQGEVVENYYRRIDPPHCYLLYKKLK
mmetsp:Transcript_12074/g.20472  ORF Transcript_12074/g.20472 Transcript_12074/m.20472 type:complete len:167 (-) Transcript_12074:40-540(-)